MPYPFLSARGFTVFVLVCLLAACGQQNQSTKETMSTPQPTSTNAKPETVEPESVEPESVEPESVEPESVEPESVEPESVEPESVKPEPVEPEPVEPEPVKPEPVAPKPVEPEPVEPEVKRMTLFGQIQLDQYKLRRQNAQIDKTVVYFQPNENIQPLPTQTHRIVTENKRFEPDVLAITRGSTVQFPVKDTILHNVFSVTPRNNFDLGLYSQGTTKNHVFNKSGIVYVHCNVHHAMQADVIVLDTPYFTYADKNGHYQLNNVPMSDGQLYFWHPRGQQVSDTITANNDKQQHNKTLTITRPKVPKHTNKFGKSYRPTRD
ncbi:MAG: hypothetical protein ACK5L8_09915 [Marinicella pacifica]